MYIKLISFASKPIGFATCTVALGRFFDAALMYSRLLVLAVELKENGQLIGDTGINDVAGKPGEVEIGYTVCKAFSGRGYATELLVGMTEFVKDEMGYRVLYGRVMKGNDASIRVLEKNGFVLLESFYEGRRESGYFERNMREKI